jgi:GWxTD domain-containing protein
MEDLPYYEDIEYFVNSNEYKYFKSLTDEGKAIYLKKFWEKHDYRGIAARFEYADAHYAEGAKTGSRTDRGRVYIKVGPPDEIEKTTIEVEMSRPYERWQYYNGTEFVFVDVRGTNEYILVWTNSAVEKKQPTYYQYLPSALRQEIEGQE